MNFREIQPEKLSDNPFKLIGSDWMLITGGSIDDYNTMTASWGGLGHLWDKNVTYCFIRPHRYTYGFIERANFYSFCFFEDKYRKILNYCGTHSGRNLDKTEKTGLSPMEGPHNTVYFAEARLVLVSRKLYFEDLRDSNFVDEDIIKEFYEADKDLHRMYIGEVVNCLVKE